MSYPKPLSQKKLDELYQNSGLSTKKLELLRSFFLSCSYLYGVIDTDELWLIYKELSTKIKVMKLQKKDIVTFSKIVRREADVPYYVYEINEVFDPTEIYEEKLIVLKSFVQSYNRYYKISHVNAKAYQMPLYVPENLLSITTPITSKEAAQLCQYLSTFKVSKGELKGKRLDEFSYLNQNERLEYDLEIKRRNRPSKSDIAYFEHLQSISEANKLVENFIDEEHVGNWNIEKMIQRLTNELQELGVILTKSKLEKIIDLSFDVHDHLHMMCLKGWCPIELRAYYENKRK